MAIWRKKGLPCRSRCIILSQMEFRAARVGDPTDLGSLAGLNAYGHEWLRGKCTEIYWESQQYGAMVD
ncbi:MAG: hypothetical protein V1800_18435 [Candidatus Latescibacterota bacterium]